MRKLQTLCLVLISVLIISSCKGGSKKSDQETPKMPAEKVIPTGNPNNGKKFNYEGYLVPRSLFDVSEGYLVKCALMESFDEKDPLSGNVVVATVKVPFGKQPNSIYYNGKGEDYTKVEIYDNEGNKYDCYSTKFKIKGKMITIEGSDNFILENVVITKL